MTRICVALVAAVLLSFPAAAQQSQDPGTAGTTTTGMNKPDERDPIGLTSTQGQMIAWSIAGVSEKQPSPQGFEPKPGAKLPDQLKSARIPSTIDQAPIPSGTMSTQCSRTRTCCWSARRTGPSPT